MDKHFGFFHVYVQAAIASQSILEMLILVACSSAMTESDFMQNAAITMLLLLYLGGNLQF